MRFTFVDRVLDLVPGASITTLKCLTLGEEYLADHFPRFPVMPGVLMLEAMTEAGAWLMRATDDFSHSIITLKEARNVRFGGFVAPGGALTVTAEILKTSAHEVELKTQGSLSDRVAVSGKLVLSRYNLADSRPELAATDAYLKSTFKARLTQLYQPHSRLAGTNGSAIIAPLSPAAAASRGKV